MKESEEIDIRDTSIQPIQVKGKVQTNRSKGSFIQEMTHRVDG